MSELLDLYQELILDHNRQPRNRGKLESPDCQVCGYNPLCGDRVTIFVTIKDEIITGISFEGIGCAISIATASLMTEAVRGLSIAETHDLFNNFRQLVTEQNDIDGEVLLLGKLNALAGVRRFPARVKCATLPWHTLMAALDGTVETVTTE